MAIPPWLTIGIAALVGGFGLYRIWLATRPRPAAADAAAAEDPARPERASVMGRGMYKMAPRTHVLVGVVYLLLAGALIATTFGWNPLGMSKPASQDLQKPAGGMLLEQHRGSAN